MPKEFLVNLDYKSPVGERGKRLICWYMHSVFLMLTLRLNWLTTVVNLSMECCISNVLRATKVLSPANKISLARCPVVRVVVLT